MSAIVQEAIFKLKLDDSEVKQGVQSTENALGGLSGIGSKLTGFGAALTTSVTLPILAIGTAAITMAAEIDKGVGEIVTLFGVSGEEADKVTAKLKQGIADVSNEVGLAQSAITEGLYNAISAGVPPDNVFAFMETAAMASVAGVTDINTAVDGITTSLNAFGLEVTEAQKVSDSMFAAVQGGKTTFAELSEALFNVAPAAAAAGVSMQEINAGIATLTASGVPTSVATTQLRAALTGLQRPSEDLDKIFQSLGYESAQVAIESKGLGFALDAVKKASNGNNGELQKLLGSTEAVAAANVIAGTGAEKFADEIQRQADAAGATEKAFATMEKTTSMQFTKLMTSLSNLGIKLGSALLPAVNALVSGITSLVDWFGSFSESTQNVILVVGGIAAAIGPVLLAIGSFVSILPALAAGLAVLTGPIGLTVAAVMALAGAATAIYSNWDGIVVWFEDLWYKVKMSNLIAIDALLAGFASLTSWIPGSEQLFAGLRSYITDAIDSTEVDRKAQLMERAIEDVATESGTTAEAIEDVGDTAITTGDAIATGFETGGEAIATLGEQVADIISALGEQTESGERVLAFKVELTEETALQNKITALQTALTTLATDTTIAIDDQQVIDLQTELTTAQGQLDAWKDAQIFKEGLQKALETLATEAGDLTTGELATLQTKIGELATQARTPEDFKAIVALNSSLELARNYAKDAEQGLQDAFDIAEATDMDFTALLDFQEKIGDINANLTGEDRLQAKIQAVWDAVGAGTVSLEEGERLVSEYNDEFERTRNLGADIIQGAMSLFQTHMPNLSKAFTSTKDAVGDFKSAFKGDNNKSFLENVGSGLTNINTALISAKGFMDDFGNAAGLAIGGLDLLVPGLGTTVSSVLGILNTLGIDVQKILKDATDALLGFLKSGSGPGVYQQSFDSISQMFKQLAVYLPNTDLTGVMGQLMEIRGSNKDETLQMMQDFLNVAFAEGLENPETTAHFENAIQQILAAITPYISSVFAGGNPGQGGGQGYTQEEQQAFWDDYDNYKQWTNYSDREIWEFMRDRFGEAMTRALLGDIPAFANGGMVFGEMLATVGDNTNAANDPEVIAPLSMLEDLLVKPTLSAIGSMMGGGLSQQVIYVTLDGRVLSQAVFEGLPEIVRMNTGGLN